jgi:hypothetical protein
VHPYRTRPAKERASSSLVRLRSDDVSTAPNGTVSTARRGALALVMIGTTVTAGCTPQAERASVESSASALPSARSTGTVADSRPAPAARAPALEVKGDGVELWLDGEEGASAIVVEDGSAYWANIHEDKSLLRRRPLSGGPAESLGEIKSAIMAIDPFPGGVVFADFDGVAFIEKAGGPVVRSFKSEEPVLDLFVVAGHLLLSTTNDIVEIDQKGSRPLGGDAYGAVAGNDDHAFIGTDEGKLLRMRWDRSEKQTLATLPFAFKSLLLEPSESVAPKSILFAAGNASTRTKSALGVGRFDLSTKETTWLYEGAHASGLTAVGDTLFFQSASKLHTLPKSGGKPKVLVEVEGGLFDYAIDGDYVYVAPGSYGRGIWRARWR